MVKEETLESRRVFEGRLLRVEVLAVALESGRRGTREVCRHPGAAVVLAELEGDRFVLVRQYRKAVERALLEVVAGTRHAGEDPAVCARRELREETGYSARELTALGVMYPSPGYSDECLHVFHARLDPEAGPRATDEDEALAVVIVTRDALESMIAAGQVTDAKTLGAWQLFTARRGAGGGAR